MGLGYEEIDRYLVGGEESIEGRQKIESMKEASAHKRALPTVASLGEE